MRKKLFAFTAVIATSMIVAAPSVKAENRVVTIVNETSRSMTAFYASNIGAKSWEENIFHGDKLRPGDSVNVNIDDGNGWCKFDLKAHFSNGADVVRGNVNVCTATSWTIYDD